MKNLTKYIGKVKDTKSYVKEIDPQFPVFKSGKDYYWFKVVFTEDSELVIYDTCGRAMPIPVELAGDFESIFYSLERMNNSLNDLTETFNSESTVEL